MSTSERKSVIVCFPSLIPDCYFAQVHNLAKTRVVYETKLYSSPEHAAAAAQDWVRFSKSKLADSLLEPTLGQI